MNRFMTTTIGLLVGCASNKSDGDTAAEIPMVNVAGAITLLLGGDGHEGVTVCNVDEGSCDTSSNVGLYSIEAPADSETWLTATIEDHRSALVPIQTDSSVLTVPNVSLSTEGIISALYTTALLEEEPGTGIIAFSISNGIFGDGINVAGVVARIDTHDTRPYYTYTLGIPSRDLEETSENGGGVFVNLPEGEHQIEFTGLPAGCTTLMGHGGPEELRTPVHAEHVSVVRIECIENTAE